MKVPADGTIYWFSEMPGDESKWKWGPDPKPHVHFDIVCDKCVGTEWAKGRYRYFNKFYPSELCTAADSELCKDVTSLHQAKQTKKDGKVLYKYNFIFPAKGKNFY
jgi:hypothetical protein